MVVTSSTPRLVTSSTTLSRRHQLKGVWLHQHAMTSSTLVCDVINSKTCDVINHMVVTSSTLKWWHFQHRGCDVINSKACDIINHVVLTSSTPRCRLHQPRVRDVINNLVLTSSTTWLWRQQRHGCDVINHVVVTSPTPKWLHHQASGLNLMQLLLPENPGHQCRHGFCWSDLQPVDWRRTSCCCIFPVERNRDKR
jgi:hypothetical protein